MNKHTRSVSLIDGHTEDRTDAEVIKALECCRDCKCKDCPCYNKETDGCKELDEQDILDLIKRQQAEIAELQHKNSELEAEIELLQKTKQLIKSETIKEFAKMFEKKIKDVKFTIGQTWEIQCALKQTLKEMTEVKENG